LPANKPKVDVTDAHVAWQFVQLRQLISTVSAVSSAAEQRLEAVDFDSLRAGRGVAISASECSDALEEFEALQDSIDVIAQIVSAIPLPTQRVLASAAEIGTEAARALREGSADPAFVMLAARVTETEVGFNALADALETDPDLATQWTGLAIGELLGAFRGTDADTVHVITDRVGVAPTDSWATLEPAALERLVRVIRTTRGDA
jgi:hypothetical protein